MKNQLFYGDNLEVLRNFVRDETVDLCYIDPPFNSKRNYNQIYNNVGKEDKAQAQAFIDTWEWTNRSNEELLSIKQNQGRLLSSQAIALITGLEAVLGRSSLLAYLVSMTQRIAEVHRVLKTTGSFYLHCDPTASHYLKLICDAIFLGKGGEFQNEIIWIYKERELSKKHWNRKHDVIFFYTKSNKYCFNYGEVMLPYSEYTLKNKFKYKDEKGFYRLRYKDGRNDPKEESEKTYRQYADKGVLPRDWFDIPILNQAAKERLGYPTQKPEVLLERIVKASSNEGDVVLDAYCGCGTTIAVAERLNRNWIGVDITYQAISLIIRRLEDSFGQDSLENLSLAGVPKDFESAIALANKKDDRIRKEFEKWMVLTFSNNRSIINEKKGGDRGIDGISYVVDKDEKGIEVYKQVIISVKSNKKLSPSVIRDLFGTMTREGAEMGYLLTLYPMPNLVKEAAQYGLYENKAFGHKYPKIQVVDVQEIMQGLRMQLPISVEVLKKAERKTKNGKTIFD